MDGLKFQQSNIWLRETGEKTHLCQTKRCWLWCLRPASEAPAWRFSEPSSAVLPSWTQTCPALWRLPRRLTWGPGRTPGRRLTCRPGRRGGRKASVKWRKQRSGGRPSGGQTWLILSGCFSAHILGRWAWERDTDSWKPSRPRTCPGSTLTTALQSVLWGKQSRNYSQEVFRKSFVYCVNYAVNKIHVK